MYIFGYGSLMNSASRQRTGNTGRAFPAIAHGLVRQWGKLNEDYTLSPLVVSQGDGQVNGMLLEVDDEALNDFDAREHGYERIQLTVDQVDTDAQLANDAVIWVYVSDKALNPCQNAPIMQTYLDTVIAGCLEVSEAFAKHFVDHTIGWEFPLENDRAKPKYGNLAGVLDCHHPIIDEMIATVRR
ncbi:gamma-glutamylcyclotransferase family protein [Vibrio sp. SCSIO 43136]|uniref:gamma-glutamylcyclotransferase family protein n=1 Tax=Vibrio sp. SCSIO 43136 TaxID=2819101 RepID=UPI002076463E|nr:gamma-glutamylcyclotransferase family protein [Vibrio sp. SCSIO 43136]USD67190.1 gamma-glutamylcyclotransferase [Vibrio sp. SCSIO 43136]